MLHPEQEASPFWPRQVSAPSASLAKSVGQRSSIFRGLRTVEQKEERLCGLELENAGAGWLGGWECPA
eukprot:2734737-Prorocentrum_lima.AAC.1